MSEGYPKISLRKGVPKVISLSKVRQIVSNVSPLLVPSSRSEIKKLTGSSNIRASETAFPKYIFITGVPGVGKNAVIKILLDDLNRKGRIKFEKVPFGTEMMKQLRNARLISRDSMRDMPVREQRELIDRTVAHIIGRYSDPATIYFLESHPVVKTRSGYMLGDNPFQWTNEYRDRYIGSFCIMSDVDSIVERRKADKSRKRTIDAEEVRQHQELLSCIWELNSSVTGKASAGYHLPQYTSLDDPQTTERIAINGRKTLGEILSRSNSPKVYKKITGLLGGDRSYKNLCAIRESGELFEMFPIFSMLSSSTVDHIYDALRALNNIAEGEFRGFYENVPQVDSSYKEYLASLKYFQDHYHHLSLGEKQVLWLEVLHHDDGKSVQWGTRHYLYGERYSLNLFNSMGISNRSAEILSGIIGMHGYLGEILLGDALPGRVIARLNSYPASYRPGMLALMNMVNFCDFMGWMGGADNKKEYIDEFKCYFDIDYLKKLARNWPQEKLKRYSRNVGPVFAGPYDPALHKIVLEALTTEVPSEERDIFRDHYLQKHHTNFIGPMLKLSPRNKIRYMHFIALVWRAFADKGLIPNGSLDIMQEQYWDKSKDYDTVVEKMLGQSWPLKLENVKGMLETSGYSSALQLSCYVDDGALFVRLG
jgi:adenylate kinase